jgi:hypothetical protein
MSEKVKCRLCGIKMAPRYMKVWNGAYQCKSEERCAQRYEDRRRKAEQEVYRRKNSILILAQTIVDHHIEAPGQLTSFCNACGPYIATPCEARQLADLVLLIEGAT